MITQRTALTTLLAMTLAACSPNAQQANQSTASQPAASQTQVSGSKRVSITAITEHPSLDQVREGVIAQLKDEGFEQGKNLTIDYQSAHGNTGTAAQIAKKFVGDKPDVVVAIATPSAQAMVAASKDIPIVYSAITDPIGAKLVKDWSPSGTNVTGMSNQQDIAPEIALIKEIVPNVQAIGYVYSPGEVNSVVMLKQLQEEAKKHNISVVEAPAQHTADVLNAARTLKGKVQVLYTGHDNNVVSAYASMYKAAVEMQVPLIASDGNSVSKGAVAAIGVNYFDLGKDTGKMVGKILRGEAAGSIPSQRPSKFELVISPKHAAEQGITLPEALKQRASKVVE